jgi:DNA polymerase I-like protein with 3'-5' exonuclease and polymerase domains
MSLIASWHPTYAFFHNPYEWGTFLIDLDRFARMIRGQLEAGPKRLNIKPTRKSIEDLHKWALRTGQALAVDSETVPSRMGKEWRFTGKQPTRAKLHLMGIGNCTEALSFEWRTNAGCRTATKRLLADERVVKIFQNGDYFDIPIMKRHGVKRIRNTRDTRDMRRALSAVSPLKLAYLGACYTDYIPWKEGDSDDEKGQVFTKNLKKKKRYNAHDCVVTARADRGMLAEPEWNTPRVQRLYQHQRSLSRIAAKMHQNGVRVNPLKREFLAWGLEKEYDARERKLLKAVGVDGFKNQPDHLKALIYESAAKGKFAHLKKFNLPEPLDPAMYIHPKEMEGLSVKEDALTLMLIDPGTPKELKRIIQLYWDANEVWKKRSTFVTSKKIEHAIGLDGRLRAGWNSNGTDTGRFACSDPNLMNIEEMIREMYEAEEGYVIIGGDYSQLELRVMAAVAEDKALEAALASGDVYTAEAIEYFSLPPNTTKRTIKKEARKAAKVIRLGRQYGAGTKKAFQIAIREDRSLQFETFLPLIGAFDRRNWRTVQYWAEEFERVSKTGYSATRIMDRRRVYPREPDRPDVANYPIQGTAADIKNLALIEVDRRLSKEVPHAKILIDLHDAIYIETREKDLAKTHRIMKDAMEVEHSIDGRIYSFPVKFKAEKNWPLDYDEDYPRKAA